MRIAGEPLQEATEFVEAVEALQNMANGIIALHDFGCEGSCIQYEVTAEGDPPFTSEGAEYNTADYGCLWILRKSNTECVAYEVVFFPGHVQIIDRTGCIDGTAVKPEKSNVSYTRGLTWVIELYSKMFWAQLHE